METRLIANQEDASSRLVSASKIVATVLLYTYPQGRVPDWYRGGKVARRVKVDRLIGFAIRGPAMKLLAASANRIGSGLLPRQLGFESSCGHHIKEDKDG